MAREVVKKCTRGVMVRDKETNTFALVDGTSHKDVFVGTEDVVRKAFFAWSRYQLGVPREEDRV